MATMVFDIETLALPLTSFDEEQVRYLLKFATNDAEREAELQKLSLYPLTAQIIAIGMVNPESNAGRVLFQSSVTERFHSEDGLIEYQTGDEKFILTSFWEAIRRYERYVTFNGRSFDCPFLMLRSSILGIRTGRNLLPYRYDTKEHCDLLDQLTFYGATRKFNLDFYCKAFGITSPKSSGITGLDLGSLYHEGRFRDIATYCLGDVRATAELFRRWEATLSQ